MSLENLIRTQIKTMLNFRETEAVSAARHRPDILPQGRACRSQHGLFRAPRHRSGPYARCLLAAGFADGCYSPLPTPSPTRTARSSLVFHNITYFPFLRRRLLKLLRFFLDCTLSTQTKILRLNDCCKPALSFFYAVTSSSCSPPGFGLQEESNDTERFSFSDSGL